MFTEILPGKQFVWNDQVVEIDGLINSWTVAVRVIATGACCDVRTSELKPLSSTRLAAGDSPIVSTEDWTRAKRIRSVLETVQPTEKLPNGEAERLAEAAGCGLRQFQRLRQRYLDNPLLTNLTPRMRGRKTGSRGLNKHTEWVITHCINKHYLKRERPSKAFLLERIQKLCRAIGCPMPSRKAVSTRVLALDPYDTMLKRYGAKAARQKYRGKPGALTVLRPLDVVQIDHTRVDVMVVSNDERRELLMRPWITLALDVYSRCVLGMYLALHAPSALSVGLCISHALLPKDSWLQKLGVDAAWPMYGRPAKILTDNATEFRGSAMARGCEQYGIILEHRPVGRPHWGGHVERLIGTIMGRVHFLPGTTFSNTKERGDYDSEKHACMTLPDLQEWLIHEICSRYHHTHHRGIGTTPAQAWDEGFKTSEDDIGA